VLVTAAVALVPALGQAFERLVGAWPNVIEEAPTATEDFQGAVFALALATILAGLAAFAVVRFPLIFVPVAVATLVAALLLVPALVDHPGIDDYASALLLTGAALFLVALVLDTTGHRDEAFWWHVFGLLALGVGFGWYAVVRHDTWAWVAILVVGGSLLLASAPFRRATWATYGLLGVYGVLVHYVGEGLGSWKEPVLLLAVSLALVALGIALQLYARLWARLTTRPAAPPPPVEPPPAEAPPPSTEPPPADDV
jgi:hypothetical protein